MECTDHEPYVPPEKEPGPQLVYISGRAANIESARTIVEAFERAGHIVTFDWTCIDVLKPYMANFEHNQPIAQAMLEGAKDASVFILLWDNHLLGALTELGAFLGKESPHKERIAYIVGPRERFSIFDTLPQIRHCETVEEVIEELKY